MHGPVWTGVFALCVAASCHLILRLFKAHRARKQMPPGPPGIPLFGNLLQLPQFQWLRFTEWKALYGPIFSLNLAGQNVVVVNDFNTATDLFDRRSSIYSDRPRWIMINEILTDGLLLTAAPYGPTWRRLRRAAHKGFNAHASEAYQPTQELAAQLLLSQFIHQPEEWYNHLKVSAGSVVLAILYGWDLKRISEHGDAVKRVNDFTERLLFAGVPGNFLVEMLPWMAHLPTWLAPFKREGYAWREKDSAFFTSLIEEVETQMRSGDGTESFVSFCLNNADDLALSRKEIGWLSAIMFGAGAETTAAVEMVFILVMVLYPDVMKRAQSEIDAVVGHDRMPAFSDMDQLPYITALVREVMRWKPVTPLALPKNCMEDDWYEGHLIPKGTMLLENVWAMNHDPDYYTDPLEFKPERFLDANGALLETMPDTHGYGHQTYGSGRRICIGKDLANQTLFINFATFLWGLDIRACADDNGNSMMPSPDDAEDVGLVVRPLPFKCSIRPRSSAVTALVDGVL